MVEHVKCLRHPVQIVIDGEPVDLLTIGHVAHVLGRTSWTIKSWIRLGLFPAAPYVLNPNDSRTRRHLYPERFVDALVEIADRGYVGSRLDRRNWQRFQFEVFAAYEITVIPLLRGVAAGPLSEPGIDVRGQAVGQLSAVM